MNFILATHLFSCFFMTGAIWIVQILVYPFFKMISEKEFKLIHDFHVKKITWVVAPMMILELGSAILLYSNNRDHLLLINLFSVILLWITTALLNVPSHQKLSFQSSESKKFLILYNWPRTFIWTLRSVFLIQFILGA